MSAGHRHHDRDAGSRRLGAVLALVVAYMLAELIGGLVSGSLALLADAGHMLSDAGALVVSLVAIRIARKPATSTHTFGYRRAEILGALINGAALVAIAGVITYEAVRRLSAPPAVDGPVMLAIACGGLLVNLVGIKILAVHRSGSLNLRAAWLHVVADALGSVGAIVSGVLITLFDWRWADPLASAAIAALVLFSASQLLRQTVSVLMQAVPSRLDLAEVERALVAIDGVRGVHDLHIWSVGSSSDIVSAHLVLSTDTDRASVIADVSRQLRDRFDLCHSTIQLDCPDDCAPCAPGAAS